MKVVLTWSADQEESKRIRDHLSAEDQLYIPPQRPYVSRYECDPRDLIPEARDAEVLMGWVWPPEFIEQASNLRLLVWLHTGCDQVDFDLLRRRNIQMANVSGANDVAIAEAGFGLMLGLAKQIISSHDAVVRAHWHPWWDPDYVIVELAGKTLAVIGLGRVGMQVAKRAKAFDMRVIGVKRDPTHDAEHADVVYGPGQLHDVLRESDFVVLTVPLTEETRHLIGEQELQMMKREAFLINVCRGDVVHEGPLYRALTEGWIAGFAADIWWDYPDSMPPSYHFAVPSRTGIHRLPNVVALAATSADTMGVKNRMIDLGIENLAAFLRGEPMPRQVDLRHGY